jgi:hypothetical protein
VTRQGKAVIKLLGGIDDNMKQITPKVHKTTINLKAVEPKLGGRWNAVAS